MKTLLTTGRKVTLHHSGIISVLFNLIDKRTSISRRSDTEYHVMRPGAYNEGEANSDEDINLEPFEMPDDMKHYGKIGYIVAELHDKDQSVFYYIPRRLLVQTNENIPVSVESVLWNEKNKS
jgi:hypothetical protein